MKWHPGTMKFIFWAAVVLFASAAQAGEFPLKSGDVVAMAGDSITAQHLHSTYFEAYCVTRFPKWNLQFRNAGVGGDTVPRLLLRLDTDVLCWPPTVVTIELGMNHAGRGLPGVPAYIEGMQTLIERVRKAGARPILLSSSPVNDGTTSDALKGGNIAIDKMSSALVELAAKEKLPCADQFHALLDVWGRNQKSPDPVPLGGDLVHIGPVGQMTMAYACLVGLDAPALVSEATLDGASAKVLSAENCSVTDLTSSGGVLKFQRADECLPMPMSKALLPALKLVPISEKLNRYMLAIKGLTAPKYTVSIDGAKVATVSAEELAKGWNMGELTEGPIVAQGQIVMNQIAKKSQLALAYRDVAKWQLPEWASDAAVNLVVDAKWKAEKERLNKAVIAASTEINKAALPKPHRFEVAPAN